MITLSKISKKHKQLPLSTKLSVDSCITLRHIIRYTKLHSAEYNECIRTSIQKELELMDDISNQMGFDFVANKLYAFNYDTNTAILIITNHQAIIESLYKVNTDSKKQAV